jgi:signal transduction histidine kinase
MRTTSVLIVEDEAIVAENLAVRLQQQGYRVADVVDSGNGAIASAHQYQPDIILMDVLLKGEIDGIAAAHEIQRHLGIPVIFMTALSDTHTQQRAKDTSPFGYIVKPFKVRDLSMMLELTLLRHRQHQLAQESLRQKLELLAFLNHEFRGPLASISLSADALAQSGPKWSESQRLGRVRRIQRAAAHLGSLLEDVWLASQIEAGLLVVAPQDLTLPKFCHDLREQLAEPERVVLQGEPLTMVQDQRLVSYILLNLLTNGLKYSQEPVLLTWGCRERRVTFHVTDRGIGIPPEFQHNLFQEGLRAKNVGDVPGTGMGLAIARTLTEQLGGQISFATTPGQGTTFTVVLPQFFTAN